MQSFLNDVVIDVFNKKDNISNLTFVLPSKRAGIFLKNAIKSKLSSTIILPKIISIEEFIEELSKLSAIDTTTLLFEFYSVYKSLTPQDTESFENFNKWAPLLLQDFNEIDRHLVDSSYLFSYLTDIKRLETLLKGEEITELISKQVQFYSKFDGYYSALYQHLLDNKLGYQGMQYREAKENIQYYIQTSTDTLVLVGFNALNTAEEYIFKQLLDNNRASIYWDIDTYFDKHNPQVSTFINSYKKQWHHFRTYPFNWTQDNFSAKKNIKIIGTPKDISQIKYAGELLKDIAVETDNFTDTALVLAQESLLSASLNSLPKEVEHVNVTMGYELKNIPLGNVFDYIFKLQTHHKKGAFYYKELLTLLNHPQIKLFFEDPNTIDGLVNTIAKNNFTYLTKPSLLKLAGTYSNTVSFDKAGQLSLFDTTENNYEFDQLSFLFDNWENNANTAIKNCIKFIEMLREKSDVTDLEKEYIFRFYTIFQQLFTLNEKFGHIKDIKTLNIFYNQMLATEKLSFQGEPLTGLQIMGVLETRVLDFKNIILTSVNEGVLPAGKSDNSFIPYDIKREVGIPTYKEKDAIFAYHFFRLLQRAENIYAIYNTEANSTSSGEQSRFLTQLEIFKYNEVEKVVVSPEVVKINTAFKEIPKNEFVNNELKSLAKKGFSASTLNNYILNPLEFYNQKILKIKEIEEVEETIAANTLGTIIHKTLEAFYKPYVGKNLTTEAIIEMKTNIVSEVQKWFNKVYCNGNISTGRNFLVFNVAQQFVRNFLNKELQLIKKGNTLKILALEQKLALKLEIEGIEVPIQFVGEADRIDELNGTTRIIDYKTGKVEQNDLKIEDWSLITKDYKKHNKAFQVLFYALLYAESNGVNLDKHPLESGIISFKNLKAGFLKVNKSLITNEDIESFKEELKQLVIEIFDINIPILEKESPFIK